MATGSANSPKTYGRKLKHQSQDIKNLYSLATVAKTVQATSGMQSSMGSIISTGSALQTLKTAGDTMIGAIAYNPKVATVDLSGEIDVSETYDDYFGGNAYTSYIMLTGSTNPDDLVTISNPTHAGQILIIETVPELVLKHNTGNIFIPDEADRTIIAGGICTLIWDTAVHSAKWTLVSTSEAGGGGGSGFINPATTDLDMNTHDILDNNIIEFNQGGSALGASTSGITASSARLHFNVPTSDYHYFTVNDVGRLKIDSGFMEIQDGIDIRNPTTTVPSGAGSGSTEVEYGDIHGWLKIQVDGGNYSIPVWALP